MSRNRVIFLVCWVFGGGDVAATYGGARETWRDTRWITIHASVMRWFTRHALRSGKMRRSSKTCASITGRALRSRRCAGSRKMLRVTEDATGHARTRRATNSWQMDEDKCSCHSMGYGVSRFNCAI